MKIKEGCKKCGLKVVEPVTYLTDIDVLIVECEGCYRQAAIDEDIMYEEDNKKLKNLKESEVQER